jgi:hypothetical protein
VPAVAWRDRRIADLQAKLREQRAGQASRDRRIADLQARLSEQRTEQAGTSSFQSRLFAERRIRERELQMGEPPPSIISNGKFWVYDLVRSHGIDVPQQYGRWDDPGDIPFAKLPDRVVIKSAFGSASRGVLPLRRSGDGWQIVTRDELVASDELVAVLRDRVSNGQIRGPFGAEEFLDGEAPGALPTDIKIYAFYGDVQMILAARSQDHGNGRAVRYRVLDVHGVDLINADSHPALSPATGRDPEASLAQVDLTLPTPTRLGELVDVASRLSVMMRTPFGRFDLYQVRDRVVFGEVTPRPGGRQWFGSDLDARLGEAWERAQARLAHDLAGGAAREPQSFQNSQDRMTPSVTSSVGP